MNRFDMRSKICRLCLNDSNEEVFRLKKVPKSNHRLLNFSELIDDKPIDLLIEQCSLCGFVSVPLQLANDFYSDYINAPSSSPQMSNFLEKQAKKFVEDFNLIGSLVLDVGCGDGGFLTKLRQAGARVVGIEPSAAQRKIAQYSNIKVISGYLEENTSVEDSPFDAIVSRQVFEHVENLHGFLRAIRSHLKVGGIGLIEVPNLDILISQGRFYDFIPEHINYFSTRTLRLALEICGLNVLSIETVQDGEAISAIFSWNGHPTLESIQIKKNKIRKEIESFLEKEQSKGSKIAVWGAGGKGISLLSCINLESISILVDSDLNKKGLYTPLSHLKVFSPDALKDLSITTVLVFAPAYRKEIIQLLTDEYCFKGTVGIVGEGFEVISIK